MQQYGKIEYWEDRYNKDKEYFEWYQRWKELKLVEIKDYNKKLKDYLNESSRVLVIGCGTSRLAEDLYDDGFKNITGIDFSKTAIVIQNERGERMKETVKFETLDIRDTQKEEGSFDLVMDKACLDAILCGADSLHQASLAVKEAYRLLADDGVYVVVSNGNPDSRLTILQTDIDWEYVYHTSILKPVTPKVPDNISKDKTLNSHYIYVCKKRKFEKQEGEEAEA